MNCNCNKWADNIGKIISPIILPSIRSGGAYPYDGIPFSHCPWCGAALNGKLPPHRRYEITVKCGGDTKFDAAAMFQDFSADISEGKTGCVHGGCSAGGFFEVKEHPEMTHEKYCADLKAHLDSEP